MHEPQVNIGADQKFSPVDVFKQGKRGETNPRISIDEDTKFRKSYSQRNALGIGFVVPK